MITLRRRALALACAGISLLLATAPPAGAVYMDGADNRDFLTANAASADESRAIALTRPEIRRILATSGVFSCQNREGGGSRYASANLFQSNRNVIIPMHVLKGVDPGTCAFFNYRDHKPVKAVFDEAALEAFKAWRLNGEPFQQDRLVVALAEPIANAAPFDVLSLTGDLEDVKVFVVSNLQADWLTTQGMTIGKFYKKREPLAYACNTRRFYSRGDAYQTNCAFGPGGSGALVFMRDRNASLKIVGMLVGWSAPRDPSGSPLNGGPYDERSRFSAAIVVPSNLSAGR
jgi:hypothetical protein